MSFESLLKMTVKILASSIAHSLRTRGGSLSGPADLDELSLAKCRRKRLNHKFSSSTVKSCWSKRL